MTDSKSRYEGEVLNCIRNGKGKFEYPDGGNNLFIYDGSWRSGIKNGPFGKFTMKGCVQITGDFSDGEITGHAVKTWSDGRRYEGEWLNGEMHGQGDWISSDGDETYKGDFQDNKREGFGILELKRSSSIYRGHFSRHKFNGFGSFLLSNYFFLEATFVDNIVQGKTIVQWQKLASFDGLFLNGLPSGRCCYSTIDKSYEFNGQFSNGHPISSQEASYVFIQLDRSEVEVKNEEIPVSVGKKG
jgi:hypothetical protein